MDGEKGHEEREEIRNELLIEIHNRLAEISKFLEVGIALFARLNSYDLEELKNQCKKIYGQFSEYQRPYDIYQDEDSNIGCSSDKGLYIEVWDKEIPKDEMPQQVIYPLGNDYVRTRPVDKETGYFLTNAEIEALKKLEAE